MSAFTFAAWHWVLLGACSLAQGLLWTSPWQLQLKRWTIGDDPGGPPGPGFWWRLTVSMTALFWPSWVVTAFVVWQLSRQP